MAYVVDGILMSSVSSLNLQASCEQMLVECYDRWCRALCYPSELALHHSAQASHAVLGKAQSWPEPRCSQRHCSVVDNIYGCQNTKHIHQLHMCYI